MISFDIPVIFIYSCVIDALYISLFLSGVYVFGFTKYPDKIGVLIIICLVILFVDAVSLVISYTIADDCITYGRCLSHLGFINRIRPIEWTIYLLQSGVWVLRDAIQIRWV